MGVRLIEECLGLYLRLPESFWKVEDRGWLIGMRVIAPMGGGVSFENGDENRGSDGLKERGGM